MLWRFDGTVRPEFAEKTEDGQESVWDYPRPPVLETVSKHILVKTKNSTIVAETTNSIRILETASPPTYYLPESALKVDLVELKESSFCEWKGTAGYLSLAGSNLYPIGWFYRSPTVSFSSIKNHVGFYPGRIKCWLEGELVKPQPGFFYGGWVTDDLAGPFKGEPDTGWW